MAMKSVNLGTAARATDLLTTGYGVDQSHFDRLVKDPAYRRQVGLAMTGQLIVTQLTREEWFERELNYLRQLRSLGLPILPDSSHEMFMLVGSLEAMVAQAYQEGFGLNHRFIPAGLTRQMLLDASAEAGIMTANDYPSGEQLPTEAGIFDCDLSKVMQPADVEQRPFMLNYDEHEAWSKEQGGMGLSSAEEVLYLILRMKLELGRILFAGGWIRCRNVDNPAGSLHVYLFAGDALRVFCSNRSQCDWSYGCVPRKFKALAA